MAGSPDFEPIKPAELPLTSQKPATGTPLPWQQRRSTWFALAACILLALLVIFVLPSLVKPPELSPVVIETGQNTTALQESPFRDAQLATARRDAQDVLAKILEKKSFLEQKQVEQWGAADFERALQAAKEGDTSYRQRDFSAAQASYQRALEQLDALEAAIPELLASALAAGTSALTEDRADEASAQFNKALAIDPASPEAATGLARAGVLDRVLAFNREAELARGNGQLDEALRLYREALALDNLNPAAQQGAQQLQQQQRQLAFNAAMSKGFSALEKNRLDRARAAFNEALKLDPDSSAARTALAQVSNTATKQSIQSLMSTATRQETAEQWHQARDNYATALTVDSSLMEARMGQLRAGARAELDDRIGEILGDPLRLSTPAVLKQARQTLADARGIKQPGDRLQEQIRRLTLTINSAVTPQTVEVLSDSDTHVTLYKVGVLGQFNRKQLSLVPGNYVAVGSRSGYRDVRVEFQVTASGRDKPVIVVCTEPVS